MSKLFEGSKTREVLAIDDKRSFLLNNRGKTIKSESIGEIEKIGITKPMGKVIKENIIPLKGITKEIKQTAGEYLRKRAKVIKSTDSSFLPYFK